MAEEQIRLLKQKLQSYQLQYENYKVQCKQIQAFLEEQAQKKQNQIRQLKQQGIKKQKQIALMKAEINVLQLQNKQLKTTIQEMQKYQEQNNPDNIYKQLEQANKKIRSVQTQYQTSQYRSKQSTNRHTQQINKLNQTIKQKTTQNEQLRNEIQMLRNKLQTPIIAYIQSPTNSQPTTPKSNHNQNINFQIAKDKGQDKKLGRKTLQIKIERTGKEKSVSLFSQQKYSQLQQMYKAKQQQLIQANNQIVFLQQKINQYQQHFYQLQNQLHNLPDQPQLFPNKTNRINQHHQQSSQHQHQQQQEYQHQDNGGSGGTHSKLRNNQQNIENTQGSGSIGTVFSVLIVAKKYYKSPFMQIQQKKNIRLYKTDKGGRIQKSLGSYRYKLNTLTYNIDSLLTQTIQTIHKNIKNKIRSRVLILGATRTNKKLMMGWIVGHFKNTVKNYNYNANTNVGSQRSIHRMQKQKQYIKYMQVQEQCVINIQLEANNRPQILRIMEHIEKEGSINEKTKTLKKNQPTIGKDRRLRYLLLQFGNIDIQLITSNFLDPEIKETQGLTNAINRMTYSRIPQYSINPSNQQTTHTQIILPINPIIGCYQQCKETLKIVNCKRKRIQKVNVFDWRLSPSKEMQLQNSRQGRLFRIDQQTQRQIQNLTIYRLNEAVQYYKNKLKELVVQIKVILNTNLQVSYLKKSPAILNLQKILRFIQNTLNYNQYEALAQSPSRNKIGNIQNSEILS